MSHSVSNLADLLSLVATSNVSDARRSDLASAIRTVSKVLGAKPEDLPIDVGFLRRRLDDVSPESQGISPRRWRNVRSLFGNALKMAVPLMDSAQKNPMSPSWQALADLLPTTDRHRLGTLMRYMSAKRIEPAEVTLDLLDEFKVAIVESRLRKNPERTWYWLTWNWNKLAAGMEQWPKLFIPRKPKNIVFVRPWSVFPDTFKDDWEAYKKLLSGEVFDEDGPPRTLRAETLAQREYEVRVAASALVASGVPAEKICSIADIARVEPIKLIVSHILNRGVGDHRARAFNMAKMLRVAARYWVKVSDEEYTRIGKIVARFKSDSTGLTDKNRERRLPFNDPALVQRYLALPQRIAGEINRTAKPTLQDAITAQVAVAIAILQVAPLRIKNLVELNIDQHLVERGNRIYIRIPGEQVKNGRPYELELPEYVADLISWYCTRFRGRLLTSDSRSLFPGEGGKPKHRRTLQMQITQRIQKYLGIPINAHLFRHIAAKILLDNRPGEYGVVSLLLNHRSVTTTMRAYTGAESISVSRYFNGLVDGLRANGVDPVKRRVAK